MAREKYWTFSGRMAPADTTAEFTTWDGLQISVAIVTADESDWLSFSATAADDGAAVADEAATINERLSGWQ